MLEEEVHILSSRQPQPGPDVQTLIDQGVVTSGAVLVQDPFDKSLYYRETEAMEQIALAKLLHFSTLCGHLGAHEVEIKQLTQKKEGRMVSLSFEGGSPIVGSGKLKKEEEELEAFAHQLTLAHEFDGGEPNVQDAAEFLQRTGLSSDNIMKDLLTKAQIQNNRLKSWNITLRLTTEARSNLKVLANIEPQVNKLPISLETNYDQKEHKQTEYTLTIAVKF